MTLAAEAPDIDILGNFKDPVFGFAHHRGFTHSFLGLLLVQALVVLLIYVIWRLRGRKLKDPNRPPRWGLLFLFAYIAGLTHILLDFTNNYGVRPFWPFWEKWYSWDIVFIIEPLLLILLVGGLVVPALFSLINDEIGVRRQGPPGRVAATVALLGVLLVWGVRDYEHRRAVNALDARLYDGDDPVRVSAFPYWLNPFQWYGVVETPAFFATMQVNSLGSRRRSRRTYANPAEARRNSGDAGGQEQRSGPRLPGLVEVSHCRERTDRVGLHRSLPRSAF